jgi:hypothetical protein
LFDAGLIVERPVRETAKVKVTKSDDLVTGMAGAVLWGRCWTGWGWSARRIAGICDRSGRVVTPVGSAIGRWWRWSWPVGT